MSTPTTTEGAPPLTINESLLAAVRLAPEGTVAIAMDPNDGELRAYAEKSSGDSVHYWRFWPRDRYTTHRDYTGESWERAPYTGYGWITLVAGGWSDVPLVPADTPAQTDATPGQRIAELGIKVAELEGQLRVERSRLQEARSQLSMFKERVGEVASRYARENDVVDSVQRAADELDIELEVTSAYSATVTFTVEFSAVRTDSSYTPEESWVQDSLGGVGDVENAIRRYLSMDDENEDFEINDISFSVDSVEEN